MQLKIITSLFVIGLICSSFSLPLSTAVDQSSIMFYIFFETPINGTTIHQRPPAELNVTIYHFYGTPMNISFKWRNHEGTWVYLTNYSSVGNGTYGFSPSGDEWVLGNTTYYWGVEVTDGAFWRNQTYRYKTSGSRYDTDQNDQVNFIDAGKVWVHRTSRVPYNILYDVNTDSDVNFIDAGKTWVNRGDYTNEIPIADFSWNVDGLSVSFNDQSIDYDGNISLWYWDFGDGENSSEQNPIHTYEDKGKYIVTLYIQDNEGAIGATIYELNIDITDMGFTFLDDHITIGEEFTITAWIDCAAIGIGAFKIEYIEWNPDLFNVTSVNPGWWNDLWECQQIHDSYLSVYQAMEFRLCYTNETAFTMDCIATGSGFCHLNFTDAGVSNAGPLLPLRVHNTTFHIYD